MDGASDALSRLAAIAEQLDDEALAALANRGLVKRAHKLCENGEVRGIAEEGAMLLVRVASFEARLAVDPGQSLCTCPSLGMCAHVLAAWIALRTQAAGRAEPIDDHKEDPLQALVGLTEDELGHWSGAALLARACTEFESGTRVTCSEDGSGRVFLLDLGIEVRWLRNRPWQNPLCSCHAQGVCVHRVVAVLGVQQERAGRRIEPEARATKPSAQAVRSRPELLAAVHATLVEVVQIGLGRLSSSLVGRVQALGTSAHGVDLPRLERELQRLGGALEALARRQADADTFDIVLQVARILALVHGLQRGVPGLVGRHRGRFVRVQELELLGLGAKRLETRSGYRGLVCYFWDVRAERFCSWSDVRGPLGVPFDGEVRYRAPGPWSGCPKPAEAAESHFLLSGAWRSESGRLSGRESTVYRRLGGSDPVPIPGYGDWAELHEHARRVFSGRLRGGDEFERHVVIRPFEWTEIGFDPIAQAFCASLVDRDQRLLRLTVPNDAENGVAIDSWSKLESCPLAVFGELRLRGSALEILPISIVTDAGLLSPTLRGAGRRGAAATDAAPPAQWSDEEEMAVDLDESEGRARAFDPSRASLVALWGEQLLQDLVDVAERGTRALLSPELESRLRGLFETGLTVLGPSLARIERASDGRERAEAILQCIHIVQRAQAGLALHESESSGA